MDDKTKEIYNFSNDLWGCPQIYKGIEFYPIKLNEFDKITLFNKVFQYPKSYITNKIIIKSSYLKFLLYFVQANSINPQGMEMQSWLIELLKFVTRNKSISIEHRILDIPFPEEIEKVLITLKINDVEFSEQEFDVIRSIILNQNGLTVEYIEEYNPQLEEYLSFVNRKFSDITLEDEIFTFCCLMKKTLNEIENYTLYQFKRHFDKLLLTFNYELYSPLVVGGTIRSKNGEELVKHFLSHGQLASRYSEILLDKDEFLRKTNLENTGSVNIK